MAWFDEPDIMVAVVALGASLASAAITAVFARRNDEKLKRLENELETSKAEQDARRDYEYEAKKRLYQEYEPLAFQLQELSISALSRLKNIARDASLGKLGPTDGWLSDMRSYYLISNVYRILAPFVAFRLMQRRLTGFDLKLNPNFSTQYRLMRILYSTFSKDFDFADLDPKLQYDPYLEGLHDPVLREPANSQREIESEKLRIDSPEKYRQQGIVRGQVDNVVEGLIEFDEYDKIYRIISFGQFEKRLESEEEYSYLYDDIFYIFLDFHPGTRPILWRILVTQAIIYKILLESSRYGVNEMPPITTLIANSVSKNFCKEFDWRKEGEKKERPAEYVYEEPFKVAQTYLQHAVSESY